MWRQYLAAVRRTSAATRGGHTLRPLRRPLRLHTR